MQQRGRGVCDGAPLELRVLPGTDVLAPSVSWWCPACEKVIPGELVGVPELAEPGCTVPHHQRLLDAGESWSRLVDAVVRLVPGGWVNRILAEAGIDGRLPAWGVDGETWDGPEDCPGCPDCAVPPSSRLMWADVELWWPVDPDSTSPTVTPAVMARLVEQAAREAGLRVDVALVEREPVLVSGRGNVPRGRAREAVSKLRAALERLRARLRRTDAARVADGWNRLEGWQRATQVDGWTAGVTVFWHPVAETYVASAVATPNTGDADSIDDAVREVFDAHVHEHLGSGPSLDALMSLGQLWLLRFRPPAEDELCDCEEAPSDD